MESVEGGWAKEGKRPQTEPNMALNSSSRAVLCAAAASEADLATSVDFLIDVVIGVVTIVFAAVVDIVVFVVVVAVVVKEDNGVDSLEASSAFFVVDAVTPDLNDPEDMAVKLPDELP